MTDPTERWLPVAGYEGLYEVSDLGRVRSLPHQTCRGVRGGKILTPYVQKPPRDYPAVMLSKSGSKVVRRLVHTLVLEAFTEPCPAGMEALHGPGGKADASLANLRWGTRAENVGPDRVRDGQSNRGERYGLSKLTWDQVCEIRQRRVQGESLKSIGNRFGITFQNVSMITTGRTWLYPPEEW